MPETSTVSDARPRVEGERAVEILSAALDVLAEVGYDKLTMDAVATQARASKATLYRRWESKASLVIDALLCHKGSTEVPDTGSLRGDLVAATCSLGGMSDPRTLGVLGSLLTAIQRDPEFARSYRRDVIGPQSELTRSVFERARARGEIGPEVDLDLLSPALAGIVLHRVFVLGEPVTPEVITQVIDEIILPACAPR